MEFDLNELPSEADAEQAIIGACVLNPEITHQAVEILGSKGDMFYNPTCSVLYETIVGLNDRNVVPDRPMLLHHLDSQPSLVAGMTMLDVVGGADAVDAILGQAYSPQNIEHYANLVWRSHIQRKMIRAGAELARLGYLGDQQDIHSLLGQAENTVYNIRSGQSRHGAISAAQAASRFWHTLEQQIADPTYNRGWQMGIPNLDRVLGYVDPGRLVVMAGRPGFGKTTSSLWIARDFAIRRGEPVMIVVYEQDSEEHMRTLVAMETGIDSLKLKHGNLLSPDELTQVHEAIARITASPLYFVEFGDPVHVKSVAKRTSVRAQEDHGKPLAMVILDYLQLMPPMPNSKAANRDREVGEISRYLKLMAKEMDIIVMLLAQLNREVERRADHRPILADLRECVIGSTCLTDADTGRQVTIAEINPGNRILGMDKDHKIRAFSVQDVWSTGVKPVYTITTRTGRQITATANHPLFTASGWKPVAELQPGDLIATASQRRDVSDLLWEDIRSIEPAGEAEVFDISVPGCGNFVANGIIAHNSGNIEQDADIVVFTYCPMAYMGDNERRRAQAEYTGELAGYEPYDHIVAKWRAGATGTAHNAWHKPTGNIISMRTRP